MAISHDLFISYSHLADARLASALEQGLEKLAKPLLKLRALDAFRDQTSLTASPGLWPGIVEHLSGSSWLILLASPASAASSWCNREILWWLENRSPDRLLLILTEGDILWDTDLKDFDWTRTTGLSRTLSQRFVDEPLYVDLRWAKQAESLSLANPRFRDALVDIAAPVRGMRKDELDGADVRQLKRNRRFVRAGISLIAVAAALAVWQAIVATSQRNEAMRQRGIAVRNQELAIDNERQAKANEQRALDNEVLAKSARAEAERQRDEAVRQRDAALARHLSIQASGAASQDLAILLAVESLRRRDFLETNALLRNLIHSRPATLKAAPTALTGGASPDAWRFSPEGTYFVAGGTGPAVSVYETTTLRELARLPTASAWEAHFSPDERYLAVADSDNRVTLYTLPDGASAATFEVHSDISSIAFSPNGRLLAVGLWTNYGIGRQRHGHAVFDVVERREVAGAKWKHYVEEAAFSPDGNQLGTRDRSGTLVLWGNGGDFTAIAAEHPNVLQWRFDPSTRALVMLTRDRALRIAGRADSKEARPRWEMDGVDAFDISANGRAVAVVRNDVIEVRERDGKAVSRIPWRGGKTNGLQFLGSEVRWLVVRSDRATLFDVVEGREVISIDRRVTAWSPDGQLLATLEERGGKSWVQFWQLEVGEPVIRAKHGDAVCTVAFDHAGTRLLTASSDGTARIWSVPQGRELTRVKHKGRVTAAWLAPDGETAVSAGEGEVKWWRTSDGAVLKTLTYTPELRPYHRMLGECDRSEGSLATAFMRSQPLIAAASQDESVRVYDLARGTMVASVEHKMDEDPLLNRDYLRIALTPDGSVLVTSNLNREGPVRFWDVSNGKLVSGKKAQKRYAGALPTHKQWPMVLGPHFKALHGSSGSERLVIQAAASGQPITELLHEGRVNDAALSPDGRYVATASADGAARLFLLRTDDLINEACRRVVTNLTEDQWNRHVSLGRPRKTCLSVPD